MNVRSPGFRTDLALLRWDGHVDDRGDHLVARTPSNPTYHWGNFVLFDRPPAKGDAERWIAIFRREFAGDPRVTHVALGWDSPDLGDPSELVARGYLVDEALVLGATAVRPPPHPNADVVVRPLEGDVDWATATQNQIDHREPQFERESYAVFKVAQMARMRAMAEAGRGAWFGAFLGDRLVADCGVYVDGDLGRFQSVGTHPAFRRRGICGTLVHAVARWGLERAPALVMVADDHAEAKRVYASVGFAPIGRHCGASWWPAS